MGATVYNVVSEFHNLCLPTPDGGLDDGSEDWTAYDDDMYGSNYLLNGDKYQLVIVDEVNTEDISTELYFKTAIDCHRAMQEYYHRHNVPYPYMLELKDAIESANGIKVWGNTVRQSQPMEFV